MSPVKGVVLKCFPYSSPQVSLGNEGEETGQPRCSATRKGTMSVMEPAAAGQWEQAGAIFVRCEQSVWTCETLSCSLLAFSPLSSTLEIFPKRNRFPFLLGKLITVIIFSFISEQVSSGSLWWLPLSTLIVLLCLTDLQLGHRETWSSVCWYLWVPSPPTCWIWRLETFLPEFPHVRNLNLHWA